LVTYQAVPLIIGGSESDDVKITSKNTICKCFSSAYKEFTLKSILK